MARFKHFHNQHTPQEHSFRISKSSCPPNQTRQYRGKRGYISRPSPAHNLHTVRAECIQVLPNIEDSISPEVHPFTKPASYPENLTLPDNMLDISCFPYTGNNENAYLNLTATSGYWGCQPGNGCFVPKFCLPSIGNGEPNLPTSSSFPNSTPYFSEMNPSLLFQTKGLQNPSSKEEHDMFFGPLSEQNNLPQMGEVIVQPDLQPALGQGNMPDMQYSLVEHRLIEHDPKPTPGQGDILQIQQNFMQQVPQQSLMNSVYGEPLLPAGCDLGSWAPSSPPQAMPFSAAVSMPIQAPLVPPDVFEPNGAVPKALSLVLVPPYLHWQQMASVLHNYVMPEDNHLDPLADQNMIPPNECHAMPDIDPYPSSYNHEGQQHPHQGLLPPTPPPDNYCAEAQQPLSQDLVLLETPSDNESTTNVSRSNQPEEQPLKKLRSPFSEELRSKTAETRRIGSCIRCQMQRIRCEANEQGECATCEKARPNTKFWRLPCLRYRITEVELYKPLTSVQNLAWTKRGNAELLGLKQFKWQSDQIRTVCLADGHTNIPIKLIVRRFFPKDGDKMKRTWVTSNGELRSVDVTPFAISDPKAAYEELDKHLSKMTYECMQKVVRPLGEVMFKTYSLASDAIQDSQVSDDEKKLLGHTLKLWMSIRLTTTSQHVVGEDTLDMQSISDDTSPLYGKVPVSPVLGAQLDTLLIDRIQYRLRNDVLKLLQKMIQRNKKHEWFSLYLAIFIILHNIALIIAHDARYARKHGLKRRYARPEKVQEYHKGANTLLAYFHYTNKTYYPFSAKCKDEDLKSLAQLDDKRMKLIRDTREYVRSKEAGWKEMREQGQNDNDFFYVSQLFQEGWKPMDMDASASA